MAPHLRAAGAVTGFLAACVLIAAVLIAAGVLPGN